jgi:hypothetical protein
MWHDPAGTKADNGGYHSSGHLSEWRVTRSEWVNARRTQASTSKITPRNTAGIFRAVRASKSTCSRNSSRWMGDGPLLHQGFHIGKRIAAGARPPRRRPRHRLGPPGKPAGKGGAHERTGRNLNPLCYLMNFKLLCGGAVVCHALQAMHGLDQFVFIPPTATEHKPL